MKTLPPGSTIGILGGGQLGRMLSMAAARLGYRCHIYAPNADSVAAEVSAEFTCAQDDDIASLTRFAESCDVITFEFENVPVDPLHQIASCAPLHPPIAALDIAQNRVAEKIFARDHGGTTAPFAEVVDRQSLDRAIAEIGAPAILKTIRMGYDGKGQSRIQPGDDLDSHWQAVAQQPCVAEGFVTFSHEFSVILVRGQNGEIRFWNTPHNVHEDGILAISTAPAPDAILDRRTLPGRWPPGWPNRWIMSACSPANFLRPKTVRYSMKWHRGCTIAATGRSRVPSPASLKII
jgi:5-(carboxyamino)imidazole ribonucleotide synthase